MAAADTKGLEWVTKIFGLEPRWTREPDMEAAKEAIRSLGIIEGNTFISFLAQGAFNKLYHVRALGNAEEFILRVSLPVDPQCKTLSEVATLDWVRRHTDIPISKVLAYEATRASPIGFEWILMTKLPGKPLADMWRSLSFPAKEKLARQFAEIVSMHFFWGDHIYQDVHRGPFSSSRDWMHARLKLSEHDCCSTLDKHAENSELDSDDEDELDDARRTLEIISRLKPIVDQVFLTNQPGDEPSMLFHDDLSQHNILVGDSGALTGVVDWECVSALPQWRACYYPSFLEGPQRDEKPDQSKYQRGANGQPTELYWEHLMEHELTVLRRVFLEEVARLEPRWAEFFESSVLQRDLDFAVENCDNEFVARHIREWTDDVTARRENVRSLQDRINQI